jgi:hypothetical protein
VRLTDVALLPLAPLMRLIAVGETLSRQGEQLIALGRGVETTLARLDESGRENAALGNEMLDVARASVRANREANVAIGELTERTERVLEHAAVFEAELPALRDALASLDDLRKQTQPLGDAAPALQSAAERVDRVASRIPGIRN